MSVKRLLRHYNRAKISNFMERRSYFYRKKTSSTHFNTKLTNKACFGFFYCSVISSIIICGHYATRMKMNTLNGLKILIFKASGLQIPMSHMSHALVCLLYPELSRDKIDYVKGHPISEVNHPDKQVAFLFPLYS